MVKGAKLPPKGCPNQTKVPGRQNSSFRNAMINSRDATILIVTVRINVPHSLVWFILVQMMNTGIWQAIQGVLGRVHTFWCQTWSLNWVWPVQLMETDTVCVCLCTWGKSVGFITYTERIFLAEHSWRTPRGDLESIGWLSTIIEA